MSAFICHTCGDFSDADDGCEETADGFHLICVDCADAAEAEREEAEDRLIAAAPDMLAALLSVQQSTEWWCMETDTQDAVRAAIANSTTPTSGEAQ